VHVLPLLMRRNLAVFLIVSSYIAGVIGIGLPIHPDFVRLTPFNLLLSAGIVLSFHEAKTKYFWYFLGISFLVGFWIEVLGVNTGVIFGRYRYDYVFGYKILGTPILIGVNWLLTAYCCGTAAFWLLPEKKPILVAVLGAGLMTGLDMLVEPVAMRYGFWSWEGDVVPLQNYVAWFITGFVLQYIFIRWKIPEKNRLALLLLLCQILFFIVLNLVLFTRS
jgi:bisanhydrobacterioruberin hydratase